jgi:hypothetical protein
MKEGFDLYWATFDGAYVAVGKCVQLAAYVHSCFADALGAESNLASSLAQAALNLVIRQFFVEKCPSNGWISR